MGELKMAAADAFVNGMQKGLEGLITGTMKAKDAFKQMAVGILKSIAQMIAKQMILNMLMGTPIGNMMGLKPEARHGGIISPPGYRSFETGGIATGSNSGYTATLHGTEAVVPLGNDRSIPVKLKGGSGSTNNTTVNVNMEGGSSTESTEEQGRALGNAIQVAVTETIVNEQLPGGLLNPLGGG